ncbi:FHF complex subunit HOOK-interacting protein 1B-like isoform X3 [Haliotis cracherodii]|uniref:FHF complex subunit HOOK-interacting protein 1B-like isoform X3 n=1 Tax=Haliotis cracherodii TaxID=6455 RepID=UPI0039E821E2
MSWFKRGSVRQEGRVAGSPDHLSNQNRRDTDPQTCLEVFRNHWQQALNVIESKKDGSKGTVDDIDTVIHNFEHMVTLLVGEEGIDGMPGPILHFLLEKEVFEKFCALSMPTREGLGKLKYDQLRMFELAINQSKQLLLIHKPVIRPLMKLLSSCTDQTVQSEEIEYRTVLVLHQICVCISQQTVILESFFNTNADHGPARFLIFSLLIPYIHREGPIGQNARDALLLLMALSAKYPHIGQYTADSDFCPVLATGLSGLYSSLPRKISPPSEDWYMVTDEDIARMPDLQMFLNSLEFCNAVIQIAHPLVKNQLIKYIYDGFLVPVLGPALHQDIPGLPLPLLDTGMFANSREEVMTATAYLDLFLRRITEPVLIRAVLKFILLEKNDEIVILDSLITRINSSSRLSLVSLSLFKTLINLNCEDVMLQLVFKYLIPCTHVMVSQRRSVKDLDLYSKSAEKFLSLRPSCCMSRSTESPKSSSHSNDKTLPSTSSLNDRNSRTRRPSSSPNPIARPNKPFGDFFSRKNSKAKRSNSQLVPATQEAVRRSPQTPTTPETRIEDFETSYFEYLHDARYRLTKCARACRNWSAPYNGETPPPDCFLDKIASENKADGDKSQSDSRVKPALDLGGDRTGVEGTTSPRVQLFSHGNMNSKNSGVGADVIVNGCMDNSTDKMESGRDTSSLCNNSSHSEMVKSPSLSKLFSSLDSLDSFIRYLDEFDPADDSASSIEDSMQSLESVLSNMSHSFNATSVGNDTILYSQESNKSGSSFHSSVRSNVDVPCSLNLRDMSSYVEITMSSPDRSNAQKVLQELPQRSFLTPDLTLSPSRWTEVDMPFSMAASPSPSVASRAFTPRYSSSAPNIGPFLAAVFSKLESMTQNSLYMNLLLTGIVAQLGAYPQPILRSFLLNHNLVFQPTVKSLVQVLSSVRQRVDNYALTIPNFENLIILARKNLLSREESYFSAGFHPVPASLGSSPVKPARAATISEIPTKEKRSPSQSLRDLLFRRSPASKKGLNIGNKGAQLQRVPGGVGYLFINRTHDEPSNSAEESLKTWNAVYCAIILDEFTKELAALAQEHAILSMDEGGLFKLES